MESTTGREDGGRRTEEVAVEIGKQKTHSTMLTKGREPGKQLSGDTKKSTL